MCARLSFSGGIALLVAYGLGHCSIIVCVDTFTEVAQHYLNWNERCAATKAMKRVCGASCYRLSSARPLTYFLYSFNRA